MKREKVYNKIDDERKYQNRLEWHTKKQDDEHSVADWIIFMEYKLNKAKNAIYQLDEKEAIKQIKKVTAIGVACLEYNLEE